MNKCLPPLDLSLWTKVVQEQKFDQSAKPNDDGLESTYANGQHPCQGDGSTHLAANTATATRSFPWIGQMSSQLQPGKSLHSNSIRTN